jgi:hypothetical protein
MVMTRVTACKSSIEELDLSGSKSRIGLQFHSRSPTLHLHHQHLQPRQLNLHSAANTARSPLLTKRQMRGHLLMSLSLQQWWAKSVLKTSLNWPLHSSPVTKNVAGHVTLMLQHGAGIVAEAAAEAGTGRRTGAAARRRGLAEAEAGAGTRGGVEAGMGMETETGTTGTGIGTEGVAGAGIAREAEAGTGAEAEAGRRRGIGEGAEVPAGTGEEAGAAAGTGAGAGAGEEFRV